MAEVVDIHAGVTLFDWVEYSVFSVMLIVSLLIGVYYGHSKHQDTVAEYMLGGKRMGVFPVTMSLVFSHISGVTLLGIPAEVYSYGTQYYSIAVSFVFVYFIVTYLYLPVFFTLQLNSMFEFQYLELRFSKDTRSIASFIYAVHLFLFIPVVLYMPALAFNEVTGVSVHVIAPIVSAVCIFYTSIGGLKAVLWTDSFQSTFTFGAIILISVIGLMRIGSITEVLKINEEGQRLEFFNMNPDPFQRITFWTMTVGSIFFWLSLLAVDPGSAQRFISVPTLGQARIVLLGSCIGTFLVNGLAAVLGLLLYVKYRDCDPVATKMVSKSGQLMPLYVMGMAKDYPGLLGLFISGVVSAALSTMSACMNTVAWTLYEDFAYMFGWENWADRKQNIAMKIICLVLGVIFTGMVLIVEKFGSLFQMVQSIAGVTNGALVGVFTLGMFFPRANTKGAIWGCIASLLGMSVISSGAQFYIAKGMLNYPTKKTGVSGCSLNFTKSLGFNASARVGTYDGVGSPVVVDPSVPLVFQLSFLYYTMAGTFIVLGVGLIVSYLTEDPPLESMDPKLFSPCVRRFLPAKQDYQSNLNEYKLVSTTVPRQEVKDSLPDDSINIITSTNIGSSNISSNSITEAKF